MFGTVSGNVLRPSDRRSPVTPVVFAGTRTRRSGTAPRPGGTVPRVELTERFADIVAAPTVALDEAALVIGAHADPSCDVAEGLAALDGLADQVGTADLDALLATLFGVDGFRGDRQTYYDPQNSYLHRVLERRRGIPVTLSVVLIEVGRRAGIELAGIGTPAHFLVRTDHDGQRRYIDAFGEGRVMDRPGLDALFRAIAPGVEVGPHLQPLASIDIVRRMLANLVAIHRGRGDRDALRWATELRTLLPDASAADHRVFGGALAACGDFQRAAKVLESIAASGVADDPARELADAQRLRARLN